LHVVRAGFNGKSRTRKTLKLGKTGTLTPANLASKSLQQAHPVPMVPVWTFY
jgi:hypothetical protein